MSEEQMDQVFTFHEQLAERALEASDRMDRDEINKIAGEAILPGLLLNLAIALAEDRALRGEVPDPPADWLRTEGATSQQ